MRIHRQVIKSLHVSRHYRHNFIYSDRQVNYGIDNTEMKHYYVATIPCFEIHRRQTECVCAEKDSDAREVSKIKATGQRLAGREWIDALERQRRKRTEREREKKKTSWCVRSQRGKERS